MKFTDNLALVLVTHQALLGFKSKIYRGLISIMPQKYELMHLIDQI